MFKYVFNVPGSITKLKFRYSCLLIITIFLLSNNIKSQTANTSTPSLNLKNSKDNSLFYVQEDGRIGVGLTTPEATLHVLGNDGLIFSGNYNKGAILNPGAGLRMMWYPRKGALRAGSVDGNQWDDRSIGSYSLATGYMTVASGDYSVALGIGNTANGQASIALGRNSISSSFFSTAIGFYASATGESSFSLGYHTLASGKYSFALGYKASTNGHDGAFCIGDASPGQSGVLSGSNNEITMRFAGGYRFFSNSSANLGVILNPEGNSWASIVDSNKRENFLVINNEDVLRKISLLKPGTWSFKGSKIKKARHYGISAQEFYYFFGKDSLGVIGTDSTISTGDFDGIALIALQGLERRTASINVTLAQIDTLVSVLKDKDSLITSLRNDVELLQNRIKEKNSEFQKLNERLDVIESELDSLNDKKALKPE